MSSYSQKVRDLAVFAMFAALMLASQIALAVLPGVQLVGMLIAALTLTYRSRALIPIYVYILLYCMYYGFSVFCFPYLYIWVPLWVIFMLAGKIPFSEKRKKLRVIVYMTLCGLFGLMFGLLYLPFQALIFNYNSKLALLWIIKGIPADVTHGVNNFAFGAAIYPLSQLLRRLDRMYRVNSYAPPSKIL